MAVEESSSISDVFESFSDDLDTAVSSAAADLAEFEILKMEEEEAVAESVDKLISDL